MKRLLILVAFAAATMSSGALAHLGEEAHIISEIKRLVPEANTDHLTHAEFLQIEQVIHGGGSAGEIRAQVRGLLGYGG